MELYKMRKRAITYRCIGSLSTVPSLIINSIPGTEIWSWGILSLCKRNDWNPVERALWSPRGSWIECSTYVLSLEWLWRLYLWRVIQVVKFSTWFVDEGMLCNLLILSFTSSSLSMPARLIQATPNVSRMSDLGSISRQRVFKLWSLRKAVL